MKKLFYVIAVIFILSYSPMSPDISAAPVIKAKSPEVLVLKTEELNRCLSELKSKIDTNE